MLRGLARSRFARCVSGVRRGVRWVRKLRSPSSDDEFSVALFANPPAELGPQTRWWWPGGAVDDATPRAQLGQFAELGYSAVEIQPFMSAVTNADLREDARIRTVGDACVCRATPQRGLCGAGARARLGPHLGKRLVDRGREPRRR